MKIGRVRLGDLMAHREEGGGYPPEFVLRMISKGHMEGDRGGARAMMIQRYAENATGSDLGIWWFGSGTLEILVVLRFPDGRMVPVQLRQNDTPERVTHRALADHGVL